MNLANTIRETVRTKYITNAYPRPNGEKSYFQDFRTPTALSEGYISISSDWILCSPNSLNFIPGVQVASFEQFNELASNRRDNISWEKIYQNKHKLAVVGYGGFMSNMLHFMEKIREMQNGYTYAIKAMVFENDEFSAMNSVRTFQDTSAQSGTTSNKTELISGNELFNVRATVRDYFTENDINDRYLIIGSPDFDTRVMLQNQNFLFFGNSDSNFVIHRSPVIDPSMTRETYGKLNIVEFWVGILEAAYHFLYLLENYSAEELRNLPHNIELWSKDIQHTNSIKLHPILDLESQQVEPNIIDEAALRDGLNTQTATVTGADNPRRTNDTWTNF